jgi:2-dehydro-3-deoxygluconokinase
MQERNHPAVITLGETMVLVTPACAEPLDAAAQFHLDAGGAESNVASHLAALGHHSAWVSSIGNDALGRRIERQIRERGVDTRWVHTDSTAPTGVYFKNPGSGVQYFRSGSAASKMNPATLDDLPLQHARLVHISGITPALSASCADLIDALVDRVAGTDTLLSFDANYRAALWPVDEAGPRLLAIARRADLVFVGLDEALVLWGTETPEQVRELIGSSQTLVVKDGDIGATSLSPGEVAFVPATPTNVVEAVGAGDAFAAGYLSAFLNGRPAAERLSSGHERAVQVLASTSDFTPTFG